MTDETNVSATPTQDMSGSGQVSSNNSVNLDNYVSKDRVNELIQERSKDAAAKAYERAKQEFERTQSQQNAAPQTSQQQQASSFGGMPQMSEEQIRQLAERVFAEKSDQNMRAFKEQEYKNRMENLANDFMGKIKAADPELVKRHEEIAELHQLVPYINDVDEVAGVTAHLLDNGHHYATLLTLANQSPERLRRELRRLSDSIKQNRVAQESYPTIREPLTQFSPSHVNADSGSTGNIESLKQQDYLRG